MSHSPCMLGTTIDPFVGHLIWLRYVLDAELSSRTLKRTYLRYELLLSQPHDVIDRLARELGIVWPRQLESSVGNGRRGFPFAFASSPSQRRQPTPQSYSRLSEWIRTSFAIFERWSLGNQRRERHLSSWTGSEWPWTTLHRSSVGLLLLVRTPPRAVHCPIERARGLPKGNA